LSTALGDSLSIENLEAVASFSCAAAYIGMTVSSMKTGAKFAKWGLGFFIFGVS
jgi:hypothetical protein